jgi:DNA-binding NarL/FixJ family response regulator
VDTSSACILLVEDFKPHRSSVVSLLRKFPDCSIVSEAADGLEAVAQAQQLRPDLILMDIGLPNMDGLEAARRIQGLVPSAKIIFLTVETDVDVMEEAFRVGGCAYVLKQRSETDLLAAVAAVLQGRQFVSSGLDGDVTPTRN